VAAQTIREQLAASALAMNEGQGDARRALQLLAEHRYLHHGVPREMGGEGDTLWEAVQAIAEVSAECLTTAFLFWCQRVFIEYLLHTPNTDLRDTLLPDLLTARRAGATGLSNAMKYLGGLEPLRTRAVLHEEEIHLDGHLPWASNLQVSRFVVAVAAQVDEHQAIVAAVPAEAQGVERSETFQLLGLQSSETASLTLRSVWLPYRWLLSDDAPAFLQRVRPGFLLLQCGLPMGIAQRALQEASAKMQGAKAILEQRVETACRQWHRLQRRTQRLAQQRRYGQSDLRRLFQTRIQWVDLAVKAAQIELEAAGGAAYFRDSGTARRWREVTFLPVLTPSTTQLALQLKHSQKEPAAR
jgi:alkylation response protein AidB-like acyl-CoA dehydrogenase